MKEYNYIAKCLITIIDNKEIQEISVLTQYGLDTNVIKEIAEIGYVNIGSIFIPYHAITSIEVIEFDKIKERY